MVARVSLLIPTHALPSFSYRIPRHLAKVVRVGAAVVAPLSGYPRLGIVVGFEEDAGDRPLEELRSVVPGLSLPESLTKLCLWAARASATPASAALRAALPPGLGISRYKVARPASHWPWASGAAVSRTSLRRTLGGDGLKAAEVEGRVVFEPAPPVGRSVEWAVARDGAEPDSLGRAPRQRELLDALLTRGGSGLPVAELLRETGAGRDSLRRLVGRGLVRLERRPEPAPVSYARGSGVALDAAAETVEEALRRGSASWIWRMPRPESVAAAAAVARAAIRRGKQALVLAPTAGESERLVGAFEKLLPAGLAIAPYHGDLEKRSRVAVYEAARRGEVDAVIGTRAGALLPLESLGAVCVMDEPDEAHRAKRPKAQRAGGYEGLPLHTRELARARGRLEGAAVFLFSPTPSLRLYAPESGARRLPPVEPRRWPAVSVVDMRGTGSPFSPALLDACRRTARRGRQTGVLINRPGRATSLRCNGCGFVWTCPSCDSPLKPDEENGLRCGSCGRAQGAPVECPNCGSNRFGATGLAVEGVRERLAEALDVEVGLLAVDGREGEEAPVVVGPPRFLLERGWDLVAVPDADDLFSGSAEKGFRVLYAAAEASREALLVQTRSPGDATLRAALEGDYDAFATSELPKRRSLGYPPHAHLAEVTFLGDGEEVRRAVESGVRPVLAGGVEVIPPVPVGRVDGRPVWRALLKGRRRADVAEAANLVARRAAKTRGAVEARIQIDPEEV